MNFALNGTNFDLTDAGAEIPAHILSGGVDVLDLDWVYAPKGNDRHSDFATANLARLGVSIETHMVVGSCFIDHSGWCEVENKYEYYSETRLLVVSKATVAAWETTLGVPYWNEAAANGFKDWAA
jgi:hypothetical protein|tara:strand:+ start:2088 stop:2462 length:375 start_codon:yes stop_codon:yes gene_type:complete